eukprot:SM000067S20339  [mRNA]  locus=s67:486872:487592:+ [translate_table: standard]
MPFQQARWRGLLYQKIRLLLSPSKWTLHNDLRRRLREMVILPSKQKHLRWFVLIDGTMGSCTKLSSYSAARCSIASEALCGWTPKDSGSCTECSDCTCKDRDDCIKLPRKDANVQYFHQSKV